MGKNYCTCGEKFCKALWSLQMFLMCGVEERWALVYISYIFHHFVTTWLNSVGQKRETTHGLELI